MQLISRILSAFPEPAALFDVENAVLVFVNPPMEKVLNGSFYELEGLPATDVAYRTGQSYANSVIGQLVSGERTAAECREREWVMGSVLRERVDDDCLALITAHGAADEAKAWVSHSRLRAMAEITMFLQEARRNNQMALQLVKANHDRLTSLEATVLGTIEDLVPQLG